MTDSLEISTFFPGVTAKQLYTAWLDSATHMVMTDGSRAEIDPQVGGRFSVSDGYITGTNLELQSYQRILQAWRTTEFPEESPDSRLEVSLREIEGGVEITLNQTNIPAGQGESYREGWEEYYFTPMKEYFSEQR